MGIVVNLIHIASACGQHYTDKNWMVSYTMSYDIDIKFMFAKSLTDARICVKQVLLEYFGDDERYRSHRYGLEKCVTNAQLTDWLNGISKLTDQNGITYIKMFLD